jgi:hypothetical protein
MLPRSNAQDGRRPLQSVGLRAEHNIRPPKNLRVKEANAHVHIRPAWRGLATVPSGHVPAASALSGQQRQQARDLHRIPPAAAARRRDAARVERRSNTFLPSAASQVTPRGGTAYAAPWRAARSLARPGVRGCRRRCGGGKLTGGRGVRVAADNKRAPRGAPWCSRNEI